MSIKSLKQSKISNVLMNKKFRGSVHGTIYMASKCEKLLYLRGSPHNYIFKQS